MAWRTFFDAVTMAEVKRRPRGYHAGCVEVEGVRPRGAVARHLHDGPPFQPLVSARMEECL
jgi:hypothetical protein